MSGPAPEDGARRAAGEIVRTALRWHGGPRVREPVARGERGWYEGAADCAHRLAQTTGGAVSVARAFGGDWPVVQGKGWLVAPALPLALAGSGGEGADAAYSWRDGSVWREAAGVEELFLTTTKAGPCPGSAFDLLWFGDCERYCLRRGTLAIEDLFALVELPVDLGILERLLVRGRRLDPAILAGLAVPVADAPAKITVNRAVELIREDEWRDPERFLHARADFERTDRRGDRIFVHTATGAAPVFRCRPLADGWVLELDGGDYPLTGFSMCRRGGALSLTAALHPTIDPLAPGMRGRLAFDLRSDLVNLG